MLARLFGKTDLIFCPCWHVMLSHPSCSCRLFPRKRACSTHYTRRDWPSKFLISLLSPLGHYSKTRPSGGISLMYSLRTETWDMLRLCYTHASIAALAARLMGCSSGCVLAVFLVGRFLCRTRHLLSCSVSLFKTLSCATVFDSLRCERYCIRLCKSQFNDTKNA